jgi:hypothetical protein
MVVGGITAAAVGGGWTETYFSCKHLVLEPRI